MSEVKIHFVKPDMACATYGNTVITSLLGQTTASSMLESQRVGRELFEVTHQKAVSITIIDKSARMPDGEVRKVTAAAMKESSGRTEDLVIIMEGEGMWTSAARAILSGLMLLSMSKNPMHIVATGREAAERVKSHVQGDTAGLEMAVQTLRRAHLDSVAR